MKFDRPLVFTSGDLREILENMTMERRKAALFALITGKTESEVVSLTWEQVNAEMEELDMLSRAIVQSIKPCPDLDNVFFEDVVPGCPVPLIGLGDSIWEAASGITLEQLQKRVKSMVLHDTEAELAAVRLLEPRFPLPFA